MNRDQRYREAHREERRLYMVRYHQRMKRVSKPSLIKRLLNKIRRTK